MAQSTVVNSGTHPVDVDDGRTLAVGESAEVDAEHAHNQALITAGQLTVLPRRRSHTREDS